MEARLLDTECLKAAQADWDRLLLLGRLPSPFCSLDFIEPWIGLYGDDYEPMVIGIFEEGKAKGFMPLALRKGGFLGNRVLNYCASRELYSDHLDIISSEEDSPACLQAVMEFLDGESVSWEELDISLVSSGSALFRHASVDTRWEARERSVAPYIDLSSGFDGYMSSFNNKHRYTLRKKARRLSEEGFSYRASTTDDIEEGIASLFELHRLRAASKGIESTFNGDRLLSLHTAAARSFDAKGRLWLRSLERNGQRIAAFYGFETGERLFYYQFGISPEWEPWSPGTVLMHKVIEEAFSRGLREFDFLRGAESYKDDWANGKRPLYSVRSYRKGVRGELSRTAFKSKDFLKKGVRRLIS